MLEVKRNAILFWYFYGKRDGGYRNRYRFLFIAECFIWQQSQGMDRNVKMYPDYTGYVFPWIWLIRGFPSGRVFVFNHQLRYNACTWLIMWLFCWEEGGSIQEKWFYRHFDIKDGFLSFWCCLSEDLARQEKAADLITGKEWLQFSVFLYLRWSVLILMFYSENDDMQNVFLFLSVGLVAINLILMEFMQNTIEKEERIKIAVLTEQNQKNRIAGLSGPGRKSMSVSEEKMHDYKNQLPRSKRW